MKIVFSLILFTEKICLSAIIVSLHYMAEAQSHSWRAWSRIQLNMWWGKQATKYLKTNRTTNKPAHEIMVLFALGKLILQTRMLSHIWFLVGPFVYFHSSCVRTAKALARLRRCAGKPEPSLVAYVISTITSWAGSNGVHIHILMRLPRIVSLITFSEWIVNVIDGSAGLTKGE